MADVAGRCASGCYSDTAALRSLASGPSARSQRADDGRPTHGYESARIFLRPIVDANCYTESAYRVSTAAASQRTTRAFQRFKFARQTLGADSLNDLDRLTCTGSGGEDGDGATACGRRVAKCGSQAAQTFADRRGVLETCPDLISRDATNPVPG